MPSAKATFEFQEPVVVKLSDEERLSGEMTVDHVGLVVSAMHRDGLVVLENAVDIKHIDNLNEILTKEAAEMAKMPTTHFNDNSETGASTGNMSQGPPLHPELMYADVWANAPAATVIANILGPKPHVNYVNGNTALGGFGGARQRVHADLVHNHAQFPFAIVTNYYLVDVSPANGSTELWLGSHRDTSFRDHRNCHPGGAGPSDSKFGKEKEGEYGIRDELLERRRDFAPPIQPIVKRGSVVLRDLRLWHAGLANPSSDPRIMLAFVHTPSWYKCPARVVLPEVARKLTEEWAARPNSPVVYDAHFVPEHLDHRKVKFNPNFSSANKGYLEMLPQDLGPGYIAEMDVE